MARRQASKRARKNSKEAVRLALARGLVRSLVIHGAVETTEVKAKELRPFVDNLVTHAREGTEAARRLVLARLGQDKEAVEGLFAHVAQINSRTSGFTRIIKLGRRVGDWAPTARLEWVDKVNVKIKEQNAKTKEKQQKTILKSEDKKSSKKRKGIKE